MNLSTSNDTTFPFQSTPFPNQVDTFPVLHNQDLLFNTPQLTHDARTPTIPMDRVNGQPLDQATSLNHPEETQVHWVNPNLSFGTYRATPSLPDVTDQPLSSDDSSPGMGVLGWVLPSTTTAHVVHSSATSGHSTEQPPWPDRVVLSPGITIPQRAYRSRYLKRNQVNHIASIFFSMVDGDGFPIRDALDRNYRGLLERDEVMFSDQKSSAISIRIEWPDYPSWTCQIRIRDWRSPPRPITLAKLGTEIGKSLERFIEKVNTNSDERTDRLWQVGAIDSDLINVNSVVLVALIPVSKSSWQPVFRLRY